MIRTKANKGIMLNKGIMFGFDRGNPENIR